MKPLYISIALSLLLPAVASADNTEAEIEYLLGAIGDSGCTFIRNGRRHDAEGAEEHLRMKYRRGKRHAPTAERFIERLASASSMSKKPYFIECAGNEAVPTGNWLTARLAIYRDQVRTPSLAPR